MISQTNTKSTFSDEQEHREYIDHDYNNKKHLTVFHSQSQLKNAYDQMLPENESHFMSPIRNWERRKGFITPIRWINCLGISLFHIIVTTWFFHKLIYYPESFQFLNVSFAVLWGIVGGFGVTAGAHRLWSHRAYKAKWPLKVIVAICFAAAGQNNIYHWVRDHRVHHKYSETTADPHDANRGFFFSHVGWLMMKKHPEVIKQGAKIDMSDITSDPLIQFHNRYFTVLKMLFCFVIPTMIPVYFLGADWSMSVLSQSVRYMVALNSTWSVNSFAHLWGNKPYDRNIMPSENWGVSVMALGEGWHNYHHTFPWDYKAAELPYATNLTTVLLDMFAAIGWAYDMKVTPKAMIKAVIENRGDKQHFNKTLDIVEQTKQT